MELKPVKIFARGGFPRLKYIADILLNDILGLSWEIVSDRRKIGKNPVINYSEDNIPGSFKISPSGLLSESGVNLQEINVTRWKDLPVFFQPASESDFPFDIFAASFYLVSRYEEYEGFTPDEFGRFRSTDSLAFRQGFLQIPVIELWAKELANAIIRKYPVLAFKRIEYTQIVTIDVDEAFANISKGLVGNIYRFFHDLAAGSGNPDHRPDNLKGDEKDPFDVFAYISEAVGRSRTETCFFFPTGDHSQYDNNPSWKNEKYRDLISKTAEKFRTGIHPSFKASDNFPVISTEIKRLKSIIRKDIRMSRFHYLRIKFPVSYRNLNEAGITEDYSMGYPDEPGFRAGISRPFPFYDLYRDLPTSLLIIPFQVMDVTLLKKCGDDTDEAKEIIKKLILETRKAGGVFTSIWHNTSLLDTPEFRKWREVFEFMLKNQG
jgi:hypothetical protein